MQHLQLTMHVRAVINETFRQQGVCDGTVAVESMLMQDGFFCGRRFQCEELQAVWFFEDNQIRFYDQAGNVTLECSADDQQQLPMQRAA